MGNTYIVPAYNKYARTRQEQLDRHRQRIDDDGEREEISVIRRIFQDRFPKRKPRKE